LAAVGPQEEIRIGEEVAVLFGPAPFNVDLHARFPGRLTGNDVNDAADGISAVFCGGRAADDLNALHVLRAEPLQLIALSAVFRKVAHDGLPVHEDQGVSRFGAADGHADAPHGVDGPRHARLVEDDVLHGLGLLLRNVLFGDNRRRLRFGLGRFFGRVDLNDNVSRFDPSVPPLRTVRRADGQAQPGKDGTGQQRMPSAPPYRLVHNFFLPRMFYMYTDMYYIL